MYHLPDQFVQTILGVHKDAGEAWLLQFERNLSAIAGKWGLALSAPYALSYNYVAPVRLQDGTEAVLKLCVPSDDFRAELGALQCFQGRGMCKLLAFDEEMGALLLERVSPGHTLAAIKDDETATRIAAGVMKQLRTPAPANANFPTVAAWASGLAKLRQHFGGGTGPIPEHSVRKAEQLFQHLIGTSESTYLLHGDLHHENMLAAGEKKWLAIDPKGVIGEAEFEVVSFLLNQWPTEHVEKTIRRRIEIFVQELGLQGERVIAWAFCHTILSAWWYIEDQVDGKEAALQKALVFERILERL